DATTRWTGKTGVTGGGSMLKNESRLNLINKEWSGAAVASGNEGSLDAVKAAPVQDPLDKNVLLPPNNPAVESKEGEGETGEVSTPQMNITPAEVIVVEEGEGKFNSTPK
ncbi:uncharacterized protein LOC142355024, partial [Convolutriloba macropyga]|uniref:uncharacterized protein LOC142355024 n=1 Tax=Convolutriloba macropyga TaxID=536237 RepID=UPI003F51E5AD